MTELDALGWLLLHSVWQATVAACGLTAFLRFGRATARLRYAAAFAALLLVAALAGATAIALAAADGTVAAGAVTVATSGAGTTRAARLVAAAHAAVAPATGWAALAWLAGVTLLLIRWAGGWWLVARMASRSTRPARPAWAASLRATAVRVGVTSPVDLRESTSVDSPTVVGHRRPVVLLPVPAFEVLARAEAESVLAHELAHVRRRDVAANAVQSVIEILFFFHPAVRWMSRTAREERELCCDDVAVRAVGSRVVYVRALARLEGARAPTRAAGFALGLASGALLRRVERLVGGGERREGDGYASRVSAALALAMTVVVTVTLGSVVLPPTLDSLVMRYTVRAHDPAGEFSVTFERGRPTRATIDGVAVGADRLVTRGDSLYLPWGSSGSFALRLERNGFTWAPRAPRQLVPRS